MGLSTLERDALDVRLEIHVVLDYADTKLTPSSGRRPQGDGAPSNFIEALAARGRPHPRRSGHGRCGGAGRARSRPPARPSPPAPPGTPPAPSDRDLGRRDPLDLGAAGRGHDLAGRLHHRPPRPRFGPRRMPFATGAAGTPPTSTTRAHVRGGTDDPSNLVAACAPCKLERGGSGGRGGPPDHWRAPSARPLGRRDVKAG